MGQEQPRVVNAFANAPGMITLGWEHDGEDVYWFVVEQEAPYTFWAPPADYRGWSITGLEPSTTYRYRVCAVYDDSRLCSDENGVGWVSITTMPPEKTPARPPPPPPPPPDCGPQLPAYISAFESLNFPGHVMRHRNFLGELSVVSSDLDRADATFHVRTGLTGASDSISFESFNKPAHFLRHRESRVRLERNDGSELFLQDATFLLRGSRGVFTPVKYESVNYPGSFIRHQNYELWLGADDGTELFKNDSTWRRLPPLFAGVPPGTISFESENFPCHFIRHQNSLGTLSRVASALDRADSTFTVRAALNGSSIGVSLESVNYPGHFLRHQNYRVRLQANDGSELFGKDATFHYNDGADPQGNHPVSFESGNLRGHHIRHTNFELWIAENDGTDLFANDATWRPVPPRQH